MTRANSASFGISSPRFHPYRPEGGALKSASSDYLVGNQIYGDLTIANDSIFDLFPGLGGPSKNQDTRKLSIGSPPTQSRKPLPPLFTEPFKDTHTTMSSPNFSVLGKPSMLLTGTIFALPNLTTEAESKSRQALTLDTRQMLMTSSDNYMSYKPSSISEMLALKLAQQALDLSLLPKRVKLIRDLSDDVIANMAETDNLIMPDETEDLRAAGHAHALAASIMSGQSPPIKYIVLSALTAPVPRSAGTPTNVTVSSKDVDPKTLKRLRNRISASRCRLRKRIWAIGLEKCEKELTKLSGELDAHIDDLEYQKEVLGNVLALATGQRD